jgi:hypothetical protein
MTAMMLGTTQIETTWTPNSPTRAQNGSTPNGTAISSKALIGPSASIAMLATVTTT